MKEELRRTISNILAEMDYVSVAHFDISAPPDPKLGDFSTNVAMVLGSRKKEDPMKLAEKIREKLEESGEYRASLAKPGFINIKLNIQKYLEEIKKILEERNDYGKSDLGGGKTVSIDFVSANPTGPVHIGNARGGPMGETIANLLEWSGFKVSRDFYLNDTGVQTRRLGESLYFYLEVELGLNPVMAEDAYMGEYIEEVYQKIVEKYGRELKKLKEKEEIIEFLRVKGLKILVERIKSEIGLLDITYDNWYSQTEIQASGKTEEIISKLEKAGMTAKREGAVWYLNQKDPDFEDKEAVLRKSDDETLTYFADDLAFHAMRFDEGVDIIIDLWGSNHHGHVPRMKSALLALGYEAEREKVILYQFVRVKEEGELIKMSKREGNFVTLEDVLKAGVEPDAFKYFIISQNPNSPIDFDIRLAIERSDKNPIFYIQYAHARIASIIRKCGKSAKSGAGEIKISDLGALNKPEEIELIKGLAEFPDICAEALEDFQIQLLPHYAYKIATLFHNFYTKCRVIDEKEKVNSPRLALCLATKIIIANTLAICDISAPEKM
jgi:arginyl-tRNA synthetase